MALLSLEILKKGAGMQNKHISFKKIFSKTNAFVFSALVLAGCSNTSVYNGGKGSFSEYEDWGNYEKRNKRSFEHGNKNTYRGFSEDYDDLDAFQKGIDSNLGGEQMRESPEIQRATMKPYQIAGKWYHPQEVSLHDTFEGLASWYGPDFHAKKTSNGETYNMYAHTAAHKTFPMNTVVKVYNVENGKSTIVRINDRGPFVEGRIIDLSNAAAKDIDMIGSGTAKVKIEVIGFKGVINTESKDELKDDESLQEEFKVGYTPQSVAGGSFALQLGAFRRKEGAQSTKEEFDKYPPYKTIIKEMLDSDNQPLYRVFLEGFQSEEEARDFMKSTPGFEGKILIRN